MIFYVYIIYFVIKPVFRPAAFITTMAKEVARYNAMQQNAQTLNINMNNNVLHKARPEILRGVELLIEKMQNEMADLLVEVCFIIFIHFLKNDKVVF